MSIIIIATGTIKLGSRSVDKDGNVISQTDAQFTEDNDGGSVVVYKANPETMKPEEGNNPSIFGDWQAAEYLEKVLEMINPKRTTNIPNFKEIFTAALQHWSISEMEDFCERCGKFFQCGGECILKEWEEEYHGCN